MILRALALGAVALALAGTAVAEDLYRGGSWPSLASDQLAAQVGDSLTVLIFENSAASNTAQSTARKNNRLSGRITATPNLDEAAQLDLGSSFEGAGQIGRAGKLAAQLSVAVIEILPNGDLRVAGEQRLNIDGAETLITLKGRVRRADISSANTVLSTRLAEVSIDYKGNGYVPRSARPGVVMQIFSWLGVV